MNTPRIEGTFSLDGLLEGPLFADDDEEHLRGFVQRAQQDNIYFSLRIEANRFSLLADQKTVPLPDHAKSASELVTKHLRWLLEPYATHEFPKLMSTVRSVEIGPGCEKQTLYPIAKDGQVLLQSRDVTCQTVPPKQPLTQRQMLTYGAVLAVITVVVLGISTLFVPYRDMGRTFLEQIQPYDINSLEVFSPSFDTFFHVAKVERDKQGECFLVTCEICETFPLTETELNAAWVQANQSMKQRLAIESLARQYIRCRLYDSQAALIKQIQAPMLWSPENPRVFALRIPFNRIVKGIELTCL